MVGRAPTLRWYLAKRFAIAIIGAFLLCSLLVFMIDFIEMLRQSGKHGSIPMRKVVELTLLRLPAYAELLIMFAVLVGSIATLLQLNRKSELAVMRSGGMSAWQFLMPGIAVAVVLGVFGVAVYNPLAAAARAKAEERFAEYFGREANFMEQSSRGTSWLRQDGVDGSSVLHAAAASDGGMQLTTVTVFRFDADGRFIERISARRARLRDGYWDMRDVWVSGLENPPEQFETYQLSTYLSPERVRDALGTIISLSVWELPALIEVAEKAGLSSAQYAVQYHLLLARPALLLVMVLLGATVSLRSFRSGGIQTMVLYGLGGAFGFFLMAEISRQVGAAGLIAPWMAVWAPIGVAWLLTTTVLLRQEDG